MSTQYGRFVTFCRDTGSRYPTLPICNLFNQAPAKSGPTAPGFGGCDLTGIRLSGADRHLSNLGGILLAFVALVIVFGLLLRTNSKSGAVGRREMQLFLLGYALISFCEIFTVGGFPLNGSVRRAFSAIHVAAVTSTSWILFLNALIGYQILEDGTAISVGLVFISAGVLFLGTGYIALDTGFGFTNYFAASVTLNDPNRSYWLYTLYLLLPLICLVLFYLLESYLTLRTLGERKPFIWLTLAAILFAIGQIFQFVASQHICTGTNGNINGSFFEILFTLLAVITVWIFWSSITEDELPIGY